MTQNEKLRALLAEARREHDGDANIGACGTDNDGGDTRCDRCKRIDAALAEPVEGFRLSEIKDAMRTAQTVEVAVRERDEARAEVERLRLALAGAENSIAAHNEHEKRLRVEASELSQEAYQRGAKAMREAAARLVAEYSTCEADLVRALSIPKEES